MKTFKNKLDLILIVLLCLISCSEKKAVNTSLIEEEIINDIFPELTIEMELSLINISPVPPSPQFFETDDNFSVKKDSILIISAEELKNYAKTLENYKFHLMDAYRNSLSFRCNSQNVVIGIDDSLTNSTPDYYYKFFKDELDNEYLSILKENINNSPNEKKIKISEIENTGCFKIKSKSDLGWTKDKNDSWRKKQDLYLSGVLGFSNIYLNKYKNFGFLDCYEIANGKEIYSRLIFVRKKEEKWFIDKTYFVN